MKENKESKERPAILDRLQQFMDHMGLSAYQINKDAGLAKGLITNAINKKLGLTTSTLESLLNAFPQLNANWLIVGRGPMLLNEEATSTSAQATNAQAHLNNLQQIQDQCVELVKLVQQIKQEEQANADNQLLSNLMK